MAIPELSRAPLLHVDATPDADYPLRILRAYRANATALWEASDELQEIYEQMNQDQLQRQRVLDAAIGVLEAAGTG